MKIALLLAALLGCIAFAHATCNPPCVNGGVCQTDGETGVSTCNCAGTGFSGASCSIAIYCPATNDFNATWPRALAKRDGMGTCSSGFLGVPRRACRADGTWADPYSTSLCHDATNTCPENYYGRATFPATTISKTATGVCDPGFSGSPTRVCPIGTGVWSSSLSGSCTRNTCPAVQDGNATWRATSSLLTSVGTCLPSFGGRVTRTCQANGTWGPINGTCTQCVGEAYANAVWPTTGGQFWGYGICNPGWQGTPRRLCEKEGIWQSYVWFLCTRVRCNATTEGNANWPSTASSSWAVGTCASGYIGSPQRFCNLDGTFAAITGSPCTAQNLQCSAISDAVYSFPAANVGTTATGSCQPGYSPTNGLPTRKCNLNQSWSSSITPNCVRNTCPAFTTEAGIIFPVSAILGNRFGSCPAGTTPNNGRNPYAYCDINGNWGSVTGGCS